MDVEMVASGYAGEMQCLHSHKSEEKIASLPHQNQWVGHCQSRLLAVSEYSL